MPIQDNTLTEISTGQLETIAVQFVTELPPAQRGTKKNIDWFSIAEELQAVPNVWAIVLPKTPQSSRALHIGRGMLVAFRPAGSFEAVTRANGKNAEGKPVYDIYARFVGVEK
jgi:hypothetical protein